MSAIDECLKRTSNSKRLYDRTCKVMPGGYTRRPFQHNPYPALIKRAEGCWMWDIERNEYPDYEQLWSHNVVITGGMCD